MTFDPEKLCTTRDGDVARILTTQMWGKKSIAAMIREGDRQKLYRYFGSGQMYIGRKSPRDLVNIPEEWWVVISHTHGSGMTSCYYRNEANAAKKAMNPKAIACLPFIDGDGLEGET